MYIKQLIESVKVCDFDEVLAALDNGADVNVHELADGWTPLHTAVFNDCDELVELLLLHGANVDAAAKVPYHHQNRCVCPYTIGQCDNFV